MHSHPQSRRGKGHCASCGTEFHNRYKPEKCVKCGYGIGGTYVPSAASIQKKARESVPDAVMLFSTTDTSLFSVKTSKRNDRCFIVKESNDLLCCHPTCKDSRAVYMISNRPAEYACAHTDLCDNATSPISSSHLCPANMEAYADKGQIECINQLLEAEGHGNFQQHPHVFQVSERKFCVLGPASSSNTLGYCHVQHLSDGSFSCSGKNCRGSFTGRMKQKKAKAICDHLHILFCCYPSVLPKPVHSPLEPGPSTTPPDELFAESRGRQSTLKLNSQLWSMPLHIPSEVMMKISSFDSLSALKLQGGWPSEFCPSDLNCLLCGYKTSDSRLHPGSWGNSWLFTNGIGIKPVTIKVKRCLNMECQAMIQLFPYSLGK